VAAAITKAALTTREGTQLIALYERSAAGAPQTFVLTQPREALAAHTPVAIARAQDPRLGLRTQRLHQTLYGSLRAMSELSARLTAGTPAQWTDTEQQVLGPVLDKVQGVAVLLTTTLAATRASLERPDGPA
jgi:hypothetical protein